MKGTLSPHHVDKSHQSQGLISEADNSTQTGEREARINTNGFAASLNQSGVQECSTGAVAVDVIRREFNTTASACK